MASRTHSQGDSRSDAGHLRKYLEGVLPEARLTTARVDTTFEPLLVMTTTYVMAAFAFPYENAHADYDVLYDGFKKYYLKQTQRPENLELAFVLCVRPDAPNLDNLSSRVETDVYFCRKFVVRLSLPLNRSLARLPFLPLTPLGSATLRPPSAQTFLQNCGISATFAKFLVVQRERSPERIVRDCLSGALGEPVELARVASDPVAVTERAGKRTRLESIQIKDFRAYRSAQTFHLGADVTVLFGPNGFGKTSLFDAIDFVVTGDIGRMKSMSDVHFRQLAKHLDSGRDDGVVSLSYWSNGDARTLIRQVNSRKQAKLDGQTTDRKAILADLTGGEFPSADRVENFVSLFRATHLFSQEHQELMKDFHPHCELSENIVSRLLAFEDYSNAAHKTRRVQEILRTEIRNTDQRVLELLERIEGETEEMDSLRETIAGHGSGDELQDAMESLRGGMTRAGISVEAGGSELDVVRGWRVAVEVRRATAQAEVDRLTALAGDAGKRPEMVVEMSRKRKLADQAENALNELRNREVKQVEELRQAELHQEELRARRRSAQTRAETLAWLFENKTGYASLVTTERELTKELALVSSRLAVCQESEEVVGKEQQRNEGELGSAEQELEAKLGDLREFEELEVAANGWQAWTKQLVEVEKAEREGNALVDVRRQQERKTTAQRESAVRREVQLAEHIAEFDKAQSEVRRILLELKSHVHGGECLLCGEDYGSREELLRRVDGQLESDSASAVRAELFEVREHATSLAEDLAAFREQRTTAERELEELGEERSKLVAQVRSFEEAVGKAGIPVDTSTVVRVQERMHLARTEVARVTQDIQELRSAGESIQGKILEVREEAAQTVATKQELDARLESTQRELERLRGNPRATSVSLDTDIAELSKLEVVNTGNMVDLDRELEIAESGVEEVSDSVDALRQQIEARESELEQLREEIGSLNNSLAKLTARLEDSGIGEEVDEETVLSLVGVESQAQAEFVRLTERAVRLEQAIDRATTAAALARARQNVEEMQSQVSQLREKSALCATWQKFFAALGDVISSQRNEATEDFTREYGPRTSVIQRRLRSVYGFDEVEIYSHESTIRVRVRRRDEELRPTDYFSQSQQQTLLLGLFLTTCISQTWSSLSTVLLDDPVTHFDNLNTYAFLDLIAGLVDLESTGHQFILSTCDEKFFQLARQRFGHLQERATFYTFSAIDEGGPVVEMVPSYESSNGYA